MSSDASILSIAAALYQEYDGERHIIGFGGKILKQAESRYSVTEIEFLSLFTLLGSGDASSTVARS